MPATAPCRYQPWRITVAEGATSWQIWDGLRQAEFLSGDVGEQPDEGWLAPDSYAVTRGQDRAELLAEMRARQETNLGRALGNPRAGPAL